MNKTADNYQLHIDHAEENFHLDVLPTATGSDLTKALERIRQEGLEIMEPEECEPDVLENGTTRYWLAYAW